MNRFLELALAGVQQLVPYVPGKPVEELQRELGLQEVVKLASNENPLGTGERVAKAIAAAVPELTLYPDGSGFALKAALSAGLNVDPQQITLGNGSSERDILLTLFDLGKQVASVVELDELLQRMPELIGRLIQFDAFAVYLLDDKRRANGDSG